MSLFRSKCDTCGDGGYVFPDQIEKIKKNDNLALYPYCKSKLAIGSAWFCIKCDASKKNGKNCRIISELTGVAAAKLIKIRSRETNLKSHGFILPSTDVIV